MFRAFCFDLLYYVIAVLIMLDILKIKLEVEKAAEYWQRCSPEALVI